MLRAQLLGGTPPDLLGAITGLTEARFPVHAPSHFSDGFHAAGTSRERDRSHASRRGRSSGRRSTRSRARR